LGFHSFDDMGVNLGPEALRIGARIFANFAEKEIV
jgi:hypothetical protein